MDHPRWPKIIFFSAHIFFCLNTCPPHSNPEPKHYYFFIQASNFPFFFSSAVLLIYSKIVVLLIPPASTNKPCETQNLHFFFGHRHHRLKRSTRENGGIKYFTKILCNNSFFSFLKKKISKRKEGILVEGSSLHFMTTLWSIIPFSFSHNI